MFRLELGATIIHRVIGPARGYLLYFAGVSCHVIEEIAMRTLIDSAVFGILGMVAAAASQAQDIGDIQQGRQLALDVCASCHAVRAGQTQSPLATAPSFEEITHMPGMTEAALAVWLTAQSHPTMPNLILSPQQVRKVSAYLLSLRD
jgi:mono/diheme cytochrome c family protein